MSRTRKAITVCSALIMTASVIFAIYAYKNQLFTSQEALWAYISGFGAMGAIVFVALQVVGVVIPIIPGGLGCLAGVVLFGAWMGFLYNYIGICVGSLAAFAISRYCGKPALYAVFKEKTIAKYESWIENDAKFAKWFAIAIFFPLAPDDFLCYLAGLTHISWRKYTAIILLGKPASIALYSLGLKYILQLILSLFK